MRIVAIADTHGKHRKVDLPGGDVLLHAGDFTDFGKHRDDFLDWFSNRPFEHRVLILGNHEKMGVSNQAIECLETMLADRSDIHFVEKQSTTIDGVTFGPAGGDHDIDVVMSHQPPFSILDNQQGLQGLRQTVARQSPRVHVFGHIHEAYGRNQVNNTICINCALAGMDYDPIHDPQVIDLEE